MGAHAPRPRLRATAGAGRPRRQAASVRVPEALLDRRRTAAELRGHRRAARHVGRRRQGGRAPPSATVQGSGARRDRAHRVVAGGNRRRTPSSLVGGPAVARTPPGLRSRRGSNLQTVGREAAGRGEAGRPWPASSRGAARGRRSGDRTDRASSLRRWPVGTRRWRAARPPAIARCSPRLRACRHATGCVRLPTGTRARAGWPARRRAAPRDGSARGSGRDLDPAR